MLGLRYHVASLAAVFAALAVGILLGVAVSGRVSDARESLEEEAAQADNDRLREEREAAREEAESAVLRGAATEELFARAYPALMEGRLAETSVAVLFLGPTDGSLRAQVERALADADGSAPARVVAVEVPLNAEDLGSALEDDELLASFADGDGDFSDLGRELGRELVEGGESPLWTALSSRLVEERSGTTSLPVDAAVVVSTWTPPEEVPDDESAVAAIEATASLLEGLVRGLDATPVPVVGIAAAGDPPELVDFYREQGISSVDDVDTAAGRLALALLLAGAAPGHYGLGEGATDGIVPPVEAVTVAGD